MEKFLINKVLQSRQLTTTTSIQGRPLVIDSSMFHIQVSPPNILYFFHHWHSEALAIDCKAPPFSWTRPFRTVQRARPGVSSFLVHFNISPLMAEAVSAFFFFASYWVIRGCVARFLNVQARCWFRLACCDLVFTFSALWIWSRALY